MGGGSSSSNEQEATMSGRRPIFLSGLILVLVCLGPALMGAQETFAIGPVQAAGGEVRSGYLPVAERDGVGASIPVTVIHGAKKGKVLALCAGVHGAEYPPILALYRLKEMIDPKALSGTVIMVHIANLPSFQRRTVYYSPSDWKNLNRVFPGDPKGTLSQRIAYVLTEEVVKRCDALIDIHCGDSNEALIPYSYWMVSGNKGVDSRSRDLTLAFGLSPIIIDTTKPKVLAESKYLADTAILMGKPAVTTEAGFLGRTDEESIARNVKGALSVMRSLKMIEGKLEPPANPVWIDKFEVVNSDSDGLFFPRVEMGATVAEGQTVGVVQDYLGAKKTEFKAPFAGIVLYLIGTPPANKGEPLFEVGRVKK
jgi:predicted deacylase